jgi:hypothetical protein
LEKLVKQRRFVGRRLFVFILSLVSDSVIARVLIGRKNAIAESGTDWTDEYPFWVCQNWALIASSLRGPLPLFSSTNDHPDEYAMAVRTTSLSDTGLSRFVHCDATCSSVFLAEYPLGG